MKAPLAPTRSGPVPLGRRMLWADHRRGAMAIAAVAAALLLVLALDATVAGALDRVTFYLRTSPADVILSQAGVRTMHMSTSALPLGTVDQAAAVPEAAWAAPLAFTTGAVGGPGGRQLTYVIGYDTTSGRGGPIGLGAGRPPGPDEAVVDGAAADQLGLGIGSVATVLGRELTVSGLSQGGTSITNTTVFVTLEQFGAINRDSVSYVLVAAARGTSPAALADALRKALPGVTVQTRAQFVASESAIVSDMSADLLALMNVLGLLVALVVIALSLFTSVLTRVRDFAVLKALGARTPRLAGVVTAQVLWTVLPALALAVVAALGLTRAVPVLAPTVYMVLTPGAVLRTAAGALLVALIAAQLPLLRLAHLDAATAFREHQ